MSGLSRGRRTWTKRVAKVAACGLLAASASMAVAGVAVAGGGNNGTVFINSVSFDANGNDPHIGCPIVLEWDGFDSNGADFTVNFAPHAPTGGTVASSGNLTGHFATVGGKHKETYYLSFTDGPQNSGEWHLDVQVDTSNSNGSSISKSKTVWVKDCGVAMDVDKDGTASGHPGDPVSYTLTVDNNNGPTTGTTTVTDSLPAGLDPGTMVYTSGAGSWTCANTTNATKSQSPSCTSSSTLPHNSVTVFTVTSAIGQNTAAGTLVNTGTVAWPGAHDSDTFNTSVLAVNANAPDVGVSKS